MTDVLLEARGLSKSYVVAPWRPRRVALRDLDLSVAAGEVVALVGPNGAGKSTALRLLAGLARPDTGTVDRRAPPGRIGYLPEDDGLPYDLSPREILSTHAALLRGAGDRARREAEEAVAAAGLAERGRHRVGTFSKGMRRRVGIAVALLGDPEIVFLDEPTAALDPWGRADVRAAIASIAGRGAAVLLATQDLDEAERVAHRVVLVVGGTARREVRPADLRARGVGLEAWALEAGA